MKTRQNFGWDDLWALFAQLHKTDPQVMGKLALALNWDGPFQEWLETRATDVQIEVMYTAPIWVLSGAARHMSSKALLKIAKARPDAEAVKIKELMK